MKPAPYFFVFPVGVACAVLAVSALSACKDKPEPKPDPGPPALSAPGPATTKAPSPCAGGGGVDTDVVSAPIFERVIPTTGFCIDPSGDVRTYGDRGKLSMSEVCTTAFDGECEVYKRFGLKRVVSLRYVDGKGTGGQVEAILSTFADVGGAYAMYTKRVIADADPFREGAPKHLVAGGDAALGSTNAYVWRGTDLVELTFLNENQAPDDMVKSARAALPSIATAIGDKLPGGKDKPAAAALLEAKATASGAPVPIAFFPSEPLGLRGVGAGAVGFYRDGTKRYRSLALVSGDVDQAKDAMKSLRTRPGAEGIKGVGDEAASVVLQSGDKSAKTEWVFVRKDEKIVGVGDDDQALDPKVALEKQAGVRLEKTAKQDLARDLAAQSIKLASPQPAFAGDGGAPPKK